jgi:hypothetical protein
LTFEECSRYRRSCPFPQFRERRRDGEIEALRHVGVLDWLIRAMPAIQSAIGGVRRFISYARQQRLGSLPHRRLT